MLVRHFKLSKIIAVRFKITELMVSLILCSKRGLKFLQKYGKRLTSNTFNKQGIISLALCSPDTAAAVLVPLFRFQIPKHGVHNFLCK